MNSLTSWLSSDVMRSLGWSLLHFLWQGTAVSALAAVLMSFCRRASTRYMTAVGALAIMLFAPVATFLSLMPSNSPSPVAAYTSVDQPSPIVLSSAPTSSFVMTHLSPSLNALPWLVEAWVFGVAFLSLRSAGGYLLLERQRRRQSPNATDRVLQMCHTLQRRLGLNRDIRYCECDWLQVPAVIGWFRPIVLLPVSVFTGLSDEQLQMIVAHELAHIQRFDAFVNVFQIASETMLFYHPAVWWLNRRIRAEREHCCDDVAVSLCGNPVEYARTLTLMETWRTAPTLAMAANRGPLSERVFHLLGMKPQNRRISMIGSALCLTLALAAGIELFGIAYPAVHAGAASLAQVPAAQADSAEAAPQSAPAASPLPAAASAAANKPSPAHSASNAQPPASSGSYIDAMKAAGLGDLTVDSLIAMKIHNITPEYVRAMQEQGLHLDADELVSLHIHNATPEYIQEIRSLGMNPNADDIVSMKIHSITPQFVRDIVALGFKPAPDDIVTMQIHGVTPDFIRSLQTAGFKFDLDDVVSA